MLTESVIGARPVHHPKIMRKIYAVRKKNTPKMSYVIASTAYRAKVGAVGIGHEPEDYEVLGEHTTGDFLANEAKYQIKYMEQAKELYEKEKQNLRGGETS